MKIQTSEITDEKGDRHNTGTNKLVKNHEGHVFKTYIILKQKSPKEMNGFLAAYDLPKLNKMKLIIVTDL